MTKISTLSLAFAIAGIASAAAETSTMTYGYCGEPCQSFGTAWTEYTALVEFPKEFVERFDGAKIIAVDIASPDNFEDPNINNFTDINLCFYTERGAEPFYQQPGQLSDKAFAWARINLDTPMTIEKDTPFFVGYAGLAPTIDDSCFAVDFDFNSNNYGLWLGYFDDYDGSYVWEPYTEWYGNLCLRLIVEGDNLPTNEVTVNDVYIPSYVQTGKDFSALVTLYNDATNDISSFDFAYKIGDVADTLNVAVNPPLVYQETREIAVNGLVCNSIGTRIAADYKITAVNGDSNSLVTDKGVHEFYILSIPEGTGYSRNVLIEEGTGTWCGWCPMGIVGIKNMSEEYTDGSFIPVAIHSGDPMESETYIEIADQYFEGYPSVVVNRDTYRFGVITEPRYEMLKAAYSFSRSIPAIAKINLNAEFADADSMSVKVSTNTEFAIASDDTHHLEYAITQNNVGPYIQVNYFAGGEDGPMGGFEDLPEKTVWTYDEVARTLYQGDALENTPGFEYEQTANLSLSDLASKKDLRIVAMIVNDATGEVENAAMGVINDFGFSSASDAVAEGYCIGADGAVKVAGLSASAYVYSVDGKLVGTIPGEGELKAAPGLYIVKAGDRSWKVMVK